MCVCVGGVDRLVPHLRLTTEMGSVDMGVPIYLMREKPYDNDRAM